MNRLDFFESISGIDYPDMLVSFFDQFIALKSIVENHGTVTVNEKTDNNITFNVKFDNQSYTEKALNEISTGNIIIYGKIISVHAQKISDTDIMIKLQ